VSDRRQLFDVAVAGPIAGFALALPALWIGLELSRPAPDIRGMTLWFGGLAIQLGDSIVTLALRSVAIPEGWGVSVHPLAFAGWLGMFVTMLNLLPIAQLDGGHILFSVLPRWQPRVALAFIGIVIALGWYSGWIGWWIFGAFVMLLSRGRIGHPPVLDAHRPLPSGRRWMVWAALALFVITFTPVPFRI
jgi:membrane-associated protease RseP (regulator of RpoE activity)